ncbi:hypothetical protein HY489_00960 [Candidatus Woesearchaeota archaeon]|nr:hypothetical protein [Candidatus Woesearchaeota archaeon]
MRKLQLVSVVMAFLLCMMPVAFAQELSVSISGKDRVSGSARGRDTLVVEAQAKIPGEDIISREQLRLYYEENFGFFDNCSRMGNSTTYKCIFEDPSFEAFEPLSFAVELRNDEDVAVKRESKTLFVDALPPAIAEFNASPLQTTGSVSVRYKVEDYGLEFGKTKGCSGVKKVQLSLNNGVLVEDSGQASSCGKDRQFSVSLNESGSLCLGVFDFLNQKASKCFKVVVDKTPPSIEQPAIVSSKGVSVTHVRKGQELIATVSVRISDELGVNKKEVFANLAAISPKFTDFVPPDTVQGNVYVWKDVPLAESAQCKVGVKAKDALGNSAQQEFECSIKSDNVAPVVKGILPKRTRDNVPLYGKGTTIVVEFDEKDSTGGAGIGMNRRQAFLDLSSLGLPNYVPASSCVLEETWRCSWLLSPPDKTPEGTYEISLVSGTSDDLDNTVPADGLKSFSIVYDNTAPAQPRITNYRVIKGEEKLNVTGAVAGNFVQYTLQSANFTEGFANFSDIGGSANTRGTCGTPENASEDVQECMFEQKIELSGPYFANFNFIFVDDAGNEANVSSEREVFGLDNETRAKYWTPEVSCSPKLLNRATASLIPPYVSCRVHLKTSRKDIAPLIIKGPSDPLECRGDVNLVLNDVYMTNTFEGSRDPILVMKLEAKDYFVNSLNITCPVSIISKKTVGEKKRFISPNPQVLDAKVKMEFYNVPGADLHKEVDRLIQEAMNDGLANADWLGTLRQIMFYFELLCRIKTIITSLVTAYTVVVLAIGTTQEILLTTPFTAGAGAGMTPIKAALCGADTGVHTVYENIIWFLDMVCTFINCGGEVRGTGAPAEGAAGTGTAGTGGGGGGSGRATEGGTPTNPNPILNRETLGIETAPFNSREVQASTITAAITGAAAQSATPAAATGPRQQTTVEKGVSAISGGLPWCTAIQTFFGPFAPNVKDSLILSTLCLCLPGIVSNVEKLRQVNCYKAVCLNDEVKERGYPASFCLEMYQYNLCQYVVGQFFATLPFAAFANKVMNMITEIAANPVAAVTIVLSLACMPMCAIPGTNVAFGICAGFRVGSMVAEAIASIVGMARSKNFFKSSPGNYCKRMEEIKKEFDKKKEKQQEEAKKEEKPSEGKK